MDLPYDASIPYPHANVIILPIAETEFTFLNEMGGGSEHQKCEPIRMVPHPRTLRKAREQVKYMVIDGISSRRIRNYLHRWVIWRTTTSTTWEYPELLQHFIDVCWHDPATAYATALASLQLKTLHTQSVD